MAGMSLVTQVSLEVVPITYFDLSVAQEAEWKPRTTPVPSTC